MKKIIFIAAACAAVFNAAAQNPMKSAIDSMSYMYGIHIARNLRMQDKTTNANLLSKAILDVFNDKTDITVDEAAEYLDHYYREVLPAKCEAEEKAYLASVERTHAGIKKTESGLLYEIIEAGDTAMKPTKSDEVTISYVGRLREGAQHDPNKPGEEFDRQENVNFTLNNVIAGMAEGIMLVGKGGKIRMWIPSSLGYGERGTALSGGSIGSFATMIFDVDLMDVKPVAPATNEQYEYNDEASGSVTVN